MAAVSKVSTSKKLSPGENKTLFISSYNDTLTSVNLHISTTSSHSQTEPTTYNLTKTHTSQASIPNPAWLSTLPSHNLLVSLNEGLDAPEGSVSVFSTALRHHHYSSGGSGTGSSDEGVLEHMETTPTLSGPVSCCFYANGKAMAAAHYSGSGVTTWRVIPSSTTKDDNDNSNTTTPSIGPTTSRLEHLQNLVFPPFSRPGPVQDRQEAPHPHQVILDPTGKFLLVPDLGADLVRVFTWDENGDENVSGNSNSSLCLRIEERGGPLRVKLGTGPRHGVFWSPGSDAAERVGAGRSGDRALGDEEGDIYFYLVGELDSSLTAYRVLYDDGGHDGKGEKKSLGFEEVCKTSTFGSHAVPEGNAAAEIAVCADNRTLIVSNRNTLTSSTSGQQRKTSSPDCPIDNLAFFCILDPASDSRSHSITTASYDGKGGSDRGKLSFTRLIDAGGRFPRHFSIDPSGSLVAVGSQLDQRVVILRLEDRQEVAKLDVGGDVTCVIWAEQ